MKNLNQTVTSILSLVTAIAVLTVSLTGGMAASSVRADEYDLRMDLNSDGSINMLDALLLYRITGGESSLSSSGGDLNGDGLVNMIDSHYLYNVVAAGASAPTTTTAVATTTTVTSPAAVSVLPEELAMLDMVNEERAKAGVAPLRFAYEDYACVKLRAAEQNILFGHVRPNGERAKSVYLDFGMEIPPVGGENVVKYAFSTADAMDGLMNSPGHKANILDTDYTAVSIGLDHSPDGLQIYVQLFKK